MSKNEILKVAAKEFAEKAKKISNIFEIAIVGSVAGNDPYPNDLDIAIVISNLNEIKTLAKYARQMSRHNPSWDVFLFNENLKTIGRLCHRRECPSTSVDCSVPGCGETPHIRMHPDFEYNEMTFFSSPIDVL
ncbi:hypothetical protein HY745_00715, partial [Candidatus Desantisbacteria bacterium]|nr:hypothetical protein [Candidatus Desantisbacteria bacterium]